MNRILVPPTSLRLDTLHVQDFQTMQRLSDQWYYNFWFGESLRPSVTSDGYVLRGYWGVEAAVALGIALIEVDVHE